MPRVPGDGGPGGPGSDPLSDDGGNGLPLRVKQANLAPQLRANPPGRHNPSAAPLSGSPGPQGPSAPPGPAGGPSPAEIRRTMSALQRGWQEGRAAGPEQASPAEGPPPADQPRGNPDGT